MQHPDTKTRCKISQQTAHDHQHDANRSIPRFHFTDGLGLVRLVDNVDDIGTPQKPCTHDKQHDDDKCRKAQCKQTSRRVKGQHHLFAVHDDQTEHPPNQPCERRTQYRACNARAERDAGKIGKKQGANLLSGCPQQQKHTGLSRFLAEENRTCVERKHGTAHTGQYKNHHHLFAGITALRQDGQHGRRAHHGDVSRDEQHGEKAASGQHAIMSPVLPSERGVYFGKCPHI